MASNKATLMMFGAIGGVLAAGAWLRAHPSGTQGLTGHAPSPAQIYRDYGSRIDAAAAAAAALEASPPAEPTPTRITPASALAASAPLSSRTEL